MSEVADKMNEVTMKEIMKKAVAAKAKPGLRRGKGMEVTEHALQRCMKYPRWAMIGKRVFLFVYTAAFAVVALVADLAILDESSRMVVSMLDLNVAMQTMSVSVQSAVALADRGGSLSLAVGNAYAFFGQLFATAFRMTDSIAEYMSFRCHGASLAVASSQLIVGTRKQTKGP